MNKLILNENFFKDLAAHYSTVWNVLKGRFWVMIRSWIDIYRIWKADSKEEFEAVVNEGDVAIDNIKREYRAYEEKLASTQGLFNSHYGDQMLFFHPGMALAEALVGPFMNKRYRQDVHQLLQDEKVGLTHLPGIGKFMQAAKKETPQGRRIKYSPDGEITGYEDVIEIEDRPGYRSPVLKVIDSIKGIFENKQPDTSSLSEKEQAKQAAKEFVAWLNQEGVLDGLKQTGTNISMEKQKQFEQIIAPAADTIKKMADLSSAKTVLDFQTAMKDLATSNKLLKDLDPGKFASEVKNSVQQIRSNEEVLEQLKAAQKTEEISDELLESIIFIQIRDTFTKNVILYLEEFYESYRTFIMNGVTEAGLASMKKTKAGAEYAKLVESNIQLLDNALQSLESIVTDGD